MFEHLGIHQSLNINYNNYLLKNLCQNYKNKRYKFKLNCLDLDINERFKLFHAITFYILEHYHHHSATKSLNKQSFISNRLTNICLTDVIIIIICNYELSSNHYKFVNFIKKDINYQNV